MKRKWWIDGKNISKIVEGEILNRTQSKKNGSIEELQDAIKKLKNGKAPGWNKITAEIIKNMELKERRHYKYIIGYRKKSNFQKIGRWH